MASIYEGRRLQLLLTRSLCRTDPMATLAACLAGGVDLVQVREKPFRDDALAWIDRVAERCAEHGVPVVVNDRRDLAEARGLGLHLGQEDLAAFPRGSLRRRAIPLGLSTHDEHELALALDEAPDAVGVGPCHATTTKGYTRGLDPDELARLLSLAPVPAFGIGGITPARLPPLLGLGLRRIAVSSCLLAAEDPRAVAADLRAMLDDRPLDDPTVRQVKPPYLR
ncbi:MAG: thiamine phosphate synthase [Planctomycetota bacterium]